MLDRLIEEAPRFFNYYNMIFFLQAMARTLALTVIGCSVGFFCGLVLAVLRQTTTPLLLPVRLAAIAYVEVFRRIPFLVILFIVLFAVQAFAPNASLFNIALISICLLSTSASAQGRADALVENIDFFLAFTKNYPDVKWRTLNDTIFVANCAIGIQKGNAGLQNFLNILLYELHSTNYINEEWEKWYGAPMTAKVEAHPFF